MSSFISSLSSKAKLPQSSRNFSVRSVKKKVISPTVLTNISYISSPTSNFSPHSSEIHRQSFVSRSNPNEENLSRNESTDARQYNYLLKLRRKRLKPLDTSPTISKYIQVISSLFTMAHCTRDRISALNILNIFVSLKYTENVDALVQMFKDLSGITNFNSITFNHNDLIAICNDSKVDKMFKALLQSVKAYSFIGNQYIFDCLLEIIKN